MEIIKSDLDNKSYKYIQLPNMLCCLLISDPETDKSAACLDVKVGSSLDPPPFYGLAHFLEHMLFMGTKKFPKENEYSVFVQNGGGMNNAYTTHSNTNYHFDIQNEYFKECLDRFSQFFISPLFNENSTEREMQAVDSEFKQSYNNDVFRLWSLILENTNENSYLNKFTVGNLETLKQEGIKDKLLEFHDKYYSSNIMKLSILGKEDINTLEQYVIEYFSQIENKNTIIPDMNNPKCFDENNLGFLYKYIPIKDKNIIQFYWVLPYTVKNYKSQPLKYLSHLFGHEGPNSLLSYLIQENLAINLRCSYEHEIWSFSFFEIEIQLTEHGLEQYEKVIQTVFEYAQIITPQQYIFDEENQIGEIDFKFADKIDQVNYCITFASLLQYYSDKEYIKNLIKYQYVVEQFDKEEIQEINKIICDQKNLNIYLKSKSFKDLKNITKWYNVQYEKQPISNIIIKKNKYFDLPPKNEFIANDFSLIQKDEKLSQKPILIQQTEISDVWYRKDDIFNKPKAIINFKLYTNDCSYGYVPLSQLFVNIWMSIMYQNLREFCYMSTLAAVYFTFEIHHDSINFKWSGFNDKLIHFMQQTIKKIKQIKFSEQEKQFNQTKEKFLQDFDNFYLNQSHKQAFDIQEQILINVHHEKRIMKKLLVNFNFENFVECCKYWLQSGKLLWYITGNFSKNDAINIVDYVEKELNIKPVKKDQIADIRCMMLKNNSSILYETILQDKTNENSCLLVYFESGPELQNLKTKMIHNIVINYIYEPFFNQLRTIEQLGYIVFSGNSINRDILGIRFIISSSKYTCEHQKKSLMSFLEQMRNEVSVLTQEQFEINRNSIINKISEKDDNIYDSHQRMWQELFTHKYMFNRQEKELKILDELTLIDFKQHFENLFFINAKRMDIMIHSSNIQIQCQNINEIKKKQQFYGDMFKQNYIQFNQKVEKEDE